MNLISCRACDDEHENARDKTASLEQELARRVEELDHTGQEIRRARLAADASSLDLEQAREELACTEQKLHRAKLAAEASLLDREHAREELTGAKQKLRRASWQPRLPRSISGVRARSCEPCARDAVA